MKNRGCNEELMIVLYTINDVLQIMYIEHSIGMHQDSDMKHGERQNNETTDYYTNGI